MMQPSPKGYVVKPAPSGQTDLDLQLALMDEVEKVIKEQSIKKPGNGHEWEDYHIYKQDKPWKDDSDAEDQEDYIIVMLDDEDTNDKWEWIVQVHIIISIHLEDDEAQGNVFLADLMNQLYNDFRRKGIIARKYELEKKAHKRFNQECYPNFYECDLVTNWKLMAQDTDLGELI